MGAIGDALVRLIDETDGSPEQLRKAFTLGQLCWNLAVTPEERRDALLAQMQSGLNIDQSSRVRFSISNNAIFRLSSDASIFLSLFISVSIVCNSCLILFASMLRAPRSSNASASTSPRSSLRYGLPWA